MGLLTEPCRAPVIKSYSCNYFNYNKSTTKLLLKKIREIEILLILLILKSVVYYDYKKIITAKVLSSDKKEGGNYLESTHVCKDQRRGQCRHCGS